MLNYELGLILEMYATRINSGPFIAFCATGSKCPRSPSGKHSHSVFARHTLLEMLHIVSLCSSKVCCFYQYQSSIPSYSQHCPAPRQTRPLCCADLLLGCHLYNMDNSCNISLWFNMCRSLILTCAYYSAL